MGGGTGADRPGRAHQRRTSLQRGRRRHRRRDELVGPHRRAGGSRGTAHGMPASRCRIAFRCRAGPRPRRTPRHAAGRPRCPATAPSPRGRSGRWPAGGSAPSGRRCPSPHRHRAAADGHHRRGPRGPGGKPPGPRPTARSHRPRYRRRRGERPRAHRRARIGVARTGRLASETRGLPGTPWASRGIRRTARGGGRGGPTPPCRCGRRRRGERRPRDRR